MSFSYEQAFSRNIGWLTAEEQKLLRQKRIAIAGLGGVGGIHLVTLTRLGVGKFHLADFDRFGIVNFNRQAGASMSTIGKPKVDVMASQAVDINPELEIRTFPEGVDGNNLDDFLKGVDLYVDGLDFFAFSAREATFAACARLGIPAVTAAPLGMGTAVLNFLPGGMTFEEYFRLDGLSEKEKALKFLIGLSPAMLQRQYLADPTAVDLAARRGPSTPMACQLCAGVAATEALKILLKRGPLLAVPHGYHFDAYRNRFVRTWRPWGNRNPLQRIVLAVARRQLASQIQPAQDNADSAEKSAMEKVLGLARWAPSGDNTQPWRFEILSDNHARIHGFDTRDHCVYDLDGRPSQIAIGALLETVRIAASSFHLRADITRVPGTTEERPQFEVHLAVDTHAVPDPLASVIRERSVQRRAMSTTPLSPEEKALLEGAAGTGFRVFWLDSAADRFRVARLMFANAKIRLTMPEAFEVHRSVIEWGARFSTDKIPDKAVGLDPFATRLMEWVLKSWERVEFFNTFLAGTLLPRIELDLWPGIRCAAHWVIYANGEPKQMEDYLDSGAAMQRFWLTATRLGLQVQPELTPLIFSRYVREGRAFSRRQRVLSEARARALDLERLLGPEVALKAVFMGRLGRPLRPPLGRSLRIPLRQLAHSLRG